MAEKKLRILLAEDSSGEASSALRSLYPEDEGRLDLTDVGSLTTLLPTMSMVNPDVVLMDLHFAKPQPVDAVRRVHRAAPHVPLIILADRTEKQEAISCLDAGAIDYLVKGFMDVRAVERALRTALERNTLCALTDLLRDPVTDLYTRDGLLALGARALETARRNGGTLVLLCLLLENAAGLREVLGSRGLEQSVRDLAGVLSTSFRRTDVVARLGATQFAALAVDAAEPSAPVLLQRVQRKVDTLNNLRDPSSTMQARIAAGFWSPNEASNFDDLLDRVEADLRTARAA